MHVVMVGNDLYVYRIPLKAVVPLSLLATQRLRMAHQAFSLNRGAGGTYVSAVVTKDRSGMLALGNELPIDTVLDFIEKAQAIEDSGPVKLAP